MPLLAADMPPAIILYAASASPKARASILIIRHIATGIAALFLATGTANAERIPPPDHRPAQPNRRDRYSATKFPVGKLMWPSAGTSTYSWLRLPVPQ